MANLFDIVVAKALAGSSGGGGGSSDFSTAEITFVIDAQARINSADIAVPQVTDIVLCQPPDFETPIPMTDVFICPLYTRIDKTGSTLIMPVYKGSFIFSSLEAQVVSSSGCDVSGAYLNNDESDMAAYFVVSNITSNATINLDGVI